VGERYAFVGYIPRGADARARLWAETAAWPGPVVAFESPKRLPGTLASLAGAAPDRPVAVCRELTKRFEEVVRGSAVEVAERFREPPKGEVTLVIGPADAQPSASDDDASEAMAELAAAGVPRRKAAEVVSKLTGVPRNKLYRESL
jgi:16S rRNA (cytidine1402-2'-O)-methyltransferase